MGGFYWSTRDQKASRNFMLGFHGNIFVQYLLKNKFALVAEFQKRHAKINGLRGATKFLNGDGYSFETNGTLYYFTEWDYFIGVRHATLEIFEAPPEGGVRWINDLRGARLDLGGYSIRIGINVRLF